MNKEDKSLMDKALIEEVKSRVENIKAHTALMMAQAEAIRLENSKK